jgi:hypothetical protein
MFVKVTQAIFSKDRAGGAKKDRRLSTYTDRPHQQSLFFDAKYALTGKNIAHILRPVKALPYQFN